MTERGLAAAEGSSVDHGGAARADVLERNLALSRERLRMRAADVVELARVLASGSSDAAVQRESADVVDAIAQVKTGRRGFHNDVPQEDVVISKAVVV